MVTPRDAAVKPPGGWGCVITADPQCDGGGDRHPSSSETRLSREQRSGSPPSLYPAELGVDVSSLTAHSRRTRSRHSFDRRARSDLRWDINRDLQFDPILCNFIIGTSITLDILLEGHAFWG